jgi:GNAT superfamily N-acetyltransferase
LLANQKGLLGYRSHPFYLRNVAQTFLARRENEICGRIAAILNYGHNERYGERRGFFGFFECVDDQQVANSLFDTVRQWFADQGIYRLRGPTNPSLNYELGMLIEGFDSPPTFMMTYNPPYYPRLLENYGFRKAQDLYAFWGHASMLPALREKLSPVAEQIIDRYNIRLRTLERSRFLEDVTAFLDIYNRSLVNTWGFVPMSDEEVRYMAKGLKYLIVPELAVGAEIDGRMVGASFALPDYNPRIRQINGRLFPFGFIRLLWRRERIKRVRVISTNVLPEYQRLGIGLVLMHALVPMALAWQLEEAEFSWVLESNLLSRGSLQKGGAKLTKTYRLYDYDEEPNAVPATTPRSRERGVQAVLPQVAGLPASRQAAAQPSATVVADAGEKAEGGASAGAGTESATSPVPAPRCRRLTIIPPKQRYRGAIEVRPVRTAAERKQFIRLPWTIYEDDPHWVPPLIGEVKEFLNPRKHPFHEHGTAVQFLGFRDGQPLGRILVSDDVRYREHSGENVGCFGMFECVEDQALAHALLDAAAAWLRDRGRTSIRGPIDYSTNYPCGLLVDGFDTPPRVLMNHHRIYYADLLESWGLQKAKDLYAWWFNDPYNLVAKWQERCERITRRTGAIIRPFRPSDFHAEIRRCREVYNAAMHRNWGFVPMSDAEFQYLGRHLARLTVPDHVLLAEVEGKAVGFAVAVPDLNEAIRPLDGRLTHFGLPVGTLRLLWRLRRLRTMRMLVLDVVDDYRRRGIADLLIYHMLRRNKATLRLEGAELGWTLEDNLGVNRVIEAVGGRRYKTYRIYERAL